MIRFSVGVQLLQTVLVLAHVTRITVPYASDKVVTGIIILFERAPFICLAVVPTAIQMTQVTPSNIEASMYAAISVFIEFSSDGGGDLLGSWLCSYLDIRTEDMTNYHIAVQVKIVCLMLAGVYSIVLPSDSEFAQLSA